MTAIDDISVGDFIVVTDDTQSLEYDYGKFPFVPIPIQKEDFSGIPVEVCGVGLPFIVTKVLDGHKIGIGESSRVITIDVRRYKVQKVSREYVEAFLVRDHTTLTGETLLAKSKGQVFTKTCPECGGLLVETRILDVISFLEIDKSVATHLAKSLKSWMFKCSKCSIVLLRKK